MFAVVAALGVISTRPDGGSDKWRILCASIPCVASLGVLASVFNQTHQGSGEPRSREHVGGRAQVLHEHESTISSYEASHGQSTGDV